jgi:hypothetical protein
LAFPTNCVVVLSSPAATVTNWFLASVARFEEFDFVFLTVCALHNDTSLLSLVWFTTEEAIIVNRAIFGVVNTPPYWVITMDCKINVAGKRL